MAVSEGRSLKSLTSLLSLALDYLFFFFVFRLAKKGSGEHPISFCFTNPQFLGVDNWLLMGSDQRQRTVNR